VSPLDAGRQRDIQHRFLEPDARRAEIPPGPLVEGRHPAHPDASPACDLASDGHSNLDGRRVVSPARTLSDPQR
jgi:hypothetical protein